jgi:anti-anti-sigma regulatory factor
MQERYNIRSRRRPGDEAITLSLNGKFCEDALGELEESLTAARKENRTVYIDLSEVTLVDRKAAQYISQQIGRDVKLINCPVYLKNWLTESAEGREN